MFRKNKSFFATIRLALSYAIMAVRRVAGANDTCGAPMKIGRCPDVRRFIASLLSKQSVYVNYIIATSKNCVTEKNQSSRGYLPVVLVSSSIRKERGSRIQSAYVGYLPNRELIHSLPETEKKSRKNAISSFERNAAVSLP